MSPSLSHQMSQRNFEPASPHKTHMFPADENRGMRHGLQTDYSGRKRYSHFGFREADPIRRRTIDLGEAAREWGTNTELILMCGIQSPQSFGFYVRRDSIRLGPQRGAILAHRITLTEFTANCMGLKVEILFWKFCYGSFWSIFEANWQNLLQKNYRLLAIFFFRRIWEIIQVLSVSETLFRALFTQLFCSKNRNFT